VSASGIVKFIMTSPLSLVCNEGKKKAVSLKFERIVAGTAVALPSFRRFSCFAMDDVSAFFDSSFSTAASEKTTSPVASTVMACIFAGALARSMRLSILPPSLYEYESVSNQFK
jgi:hypothetical protein